MAVRRDRMSAAGGILSYFTRHATAANLVLALFIVAGLSAIPQMRAQYFPDVVTPEISVVVQWEGAGAEDIDRAIVELMEPSLIGIDGVEATRTNSRDGRAAFTLEFEPDWDMGQALDEVQATVDAVQNLPADSERPEVRRVIWGDRVTDLVITGPVAPAQLAGLADELLARLFRAGVTRARIDGIAEPEITVEVSMIDLMRHRVTLAEIAARISAEAATDPAGEVGDGSARLRTGREKRDPDALAGIVLRTNADGSSLTLGEVARLRAVGGQEAHAYYVGQNPAMRLRVDRSADGDAIAIQRQVEIVADEMRPTLPEGVTIDLIRTRSEDILARLNILLDNGLMGLGLVVTLLFLFLNARTAFWVATGIPVAMLGAIALMHFAGLTINMISLFALILTLGIVVDDAIVVGEHADFRYRQLGEPPVIAAENAVRRMAAPVFSSTVTTIIAFLGLMTITGRFGDLIQDIPLTVSVVLLASLLECFLILPNHMGHALSKAGRGRWYDAPSRVMNRGLGWVRDRLVRPLTHWVIVARYPVLAAALALLAYQSGLFLKGEVQWRFFNSPERATVTGNFTMLAGARRADTVEVMHQLQAATEEVAAKYRAEYGVEPLSYVISEIGANGWPALASAEAKDRDLLGSIAIELVDPDLRPWSAFDFVADLQEAAPSHPFLEELSFRGWRHGPAGEALDVQFFGAEAATLKAAAEALKRAMAPFPEVSGLDDTMPYDKDELILELTPQGQALGFTIEALGQELRDRLTGIEAATFPTGMRTTKIMVELPKDELTADFLERMLLPTAAGSYVALSDIVTVQRQGGFSTIGRENGQRVISVTGDIAEDDPDRAAAIVAALDGDILPRIAEEFGVGYHLAGLAEQEDTFLSDALVGLAAALVGIYAVLAWIFSSWTRPMVVMSVIPFGLIGAIHGHAVWDIPMSMFSVVGLIGMSGIIINDAIVLITTVDDYAETRAREPAIIDAVADRLRPVMLTTATTVLGLAPLLYETSRQAQFLRPTVVTLCYGLGFGMVLVLLVVPALLAAQRDIGRLTVSLRRAVRGRPLRMLVLADAVMLALVFGVILLPALIAGGPLAPALGQFVLGAALVTLLCGIAGAVILRRRGQPVQP
ncbi:efflux RND transporter permease subunit [Defluviimonas sp. WL0050]|uniref:Efflux RND transporter permease subunit n=1 Tax=Albidovulum litorale TaxID=2984134 RepID=A0ABT2ZSE1_9RHOB|nr:efflux RND transporter permease subunit [Defluviimonas sp. WL0050]MCV2874071.1 efflux RND transporter permease subunit [Defluviimonas sp. WL0050]